MALREAGVVFEGDVLFVFAAELRNDGEGADFYQRVTQEIEKNSGIGRNSGSGRIAGGHAGDGSESYENVAGVGDGAVGQQSFDVGLNERAEISGKHSGDGKNPESPEPVLRGGRNRREYAQEQCEGCGLWSGGEERSDGGGRAFIDVGRPDLEGSDRYLEAQADQDKRQPELKQDAVGIGTAHGIENGRARGAVDQRNAIEEERR